MKRTLFFMLLSALLWGGVATVQAAIYSGSCGAEGANVTWKLDTGTGVLEISGAGKMGTYNRYGYGATAPWYDYRTSITSVTIDDRVTTIGESAFDGCEDLTSVTIPNSVTTIGDDAFWGCKGLTSVKIPNSVTTIGISAFSDCFGLKNVYISDLAAWCRIDFKGYFSNPLSYAHNLYLDNTLVTDLKIPNDITEIHPYAFKDCTSLMSVTIPESVQTIGYSAFDGCYKLTSVTISNSVTTIGDYAFRRCERLISVTIPDGVTTIGYGAFDWCRGLKSVTIGKNVTTIGNYAFSGCSGLTSVTIPESVTSIGVCAFSGCTNLTEFKGKLASFDNRCLVINGTLVAFAPSGLTEYSIPNEVNVIGDYAFSNCTGLASVTIPNSVTSIGENAFYGCTGLTSVTIPNSVTSIGAGAFYGCTGLTSVTAYNPTPVDIVVTSEWWGGSCFAFENVDCANCTLYVPAESVNEYQLAEGWREFGEILPIDESSAITEIRQDNADGHVTVYNLQGVLVLETDDAADLKTLQNGAYIVNGKKMIITR